MPPLKRNPKFHQGYFKPNFPSKYIGKELPIYRSGIEKKFFLFLDNNPKVLRWSSEPFPIPYFDSVKNKNRNYYIDAYVEILEGREVKRYLVELKDHKETKKPDPKSKKKKSALIFEQLTYETNCCKWRFAITFAEQHQCEFLLISHSQNDGFLPVKLDFLM